MLSAEDGALMLIPCSKNRWMERFLSQRLPLQVEPVGRARPGAEKGEWLGHHQSQQLRTCISCTGKRLLYHLGSALQEGQPCQFSSTQLRRVRVPDSCPSSPPAFSSSERSRSGVPHPSGHHDL